MTLRSILWLVIPLTGLVACSDAPPEVAEHADIASSRADAIRNGQNDTNTPVNNAVVKLTGPNNGNLCTGTLITSSLVLSAAHCINGLGAGFNNPGPSNAASVGATVGVNVTTPFAAPRSDAPGNALEATQTGGAAPPRIVQATPMVTGPVTTSAQGSDVVVLRIYPPVVAEAYARKPTFQSPPGFTAGQIQTLNATMVGWGRLSNGSFATVRQAATLPLPLANDGAIIRFDSGPTSPDIGDSGGPLFIQGYGQMGIDSSSQSDGGTKWVNITSQAAQTFIQNTSADPVRFGKWIGETDYIGACDTVNDPDCDRFYDTIPGTSIWGSDNCPGVYNPAQFPARDTDNNGLPNETADADDDADGIPNYCDPNPNCPRGVDQGDEDGDGLCNGLDPCPCTQLSGTVNSPLGETDGDGACEACTVTPFGQPSAYCTTFCTQNPADTCPGVNNNQSLNANYLAEDAHDAMVLGDACEPIPYPLIDSVSQITVATALGAAQSGGSGSGNWLMRTVNVDNKLTGFTTIPTGSSGAPKAVNLFGTPGLQKAFTIANSDYRGCLYDANVNCEDPNSYSDNLASPSKLRASEARDDYWHRLQLSRRTGPSTWTPITPDSADGSIVYDFSGTKREFRWDWAADFSVWTSTWGAQIGLQTPSDPTAPNLTRIWTHARIDEPGQAFNDSQTGYHPRKSSPTVATEQLANHYRDDQFLVRSYRQQWTTIPMYKPNPWIYERIVEAVRNPGIPVMKDRPGLRFRTNVLLHMNIGAGLSGNVASLQDDATTVEASGRVSSTLLTQRQNGAIFVNAAEVDAGLGPNNPVLYVLSSSGDAVSDIVRLRNDQFVGTGDRGYYAAKAPTGSSPSLEAQQDVSDAAAVKAGAKAAESTDAKALQADQAGAQVTMSAQARGPGYPDVRQGFVTAYTRARNKVFVVGGTSTRSGQTLTDIWMYRTGTWQPINTAFAVGRPLAATYSFRNDRLWVVDEVLVGRTLTARLVTIEPETGAYQVLGSWARTGTFNDVWLSLDKDGNVLLTSSSASGAQYVVTKLLALSTPTVDQQVRASGELAFAPVVDPTGYAFAVVPGAKKMPTLARRATLNGTRAGWSDLAGTL